MEKKIVFDEVFELQKNGKQEEFTFGEINIPLLPTDIIHIEREDSFYSENNSWNAFSRLVILRGREETDEEFNERKESSEFFEKKFKSKRYEQYLKLKKEFEK